MQPVSRGPAPNQLNLDLYKFMNKDEIKKDLTM